MKTLTFDNGKEFAAHETIAQALDCEPYFAKPYHSWERGQNENANGLLRQYFPKTMELIDVTTQAAFKAVHKLTAGPGSAWALKRLMKLCTDVFIRHSSARSVGLPGSVSSNEGRALADPENNVVTKIMVVINRVIFVVS